MSAAFFEKIDVFLPGQGETLTQAPAHRWERAEHAGAEIYYNTQEPKSVLIHLKGVSREERKALADMPIELDLTALRYHDFDGFGVHLPGLLATTRGTIIATCQKRHNTRRVNQARFRGCAGDCCTATTTERAGRQAPFCPTALTRSQWWKRHGATSTSAIARTLRPPASATSHAVPITARPSANTASTRIFQPSQQAGRERSADPRKRAIGRINNPSAQTHSSASDLGDSIATGDRMIVAPRGYFIRRQ